MKGFSFVSDRYDGKEIGNRLALEKIYLFYFKKFQMDDVLFFYCNFICLL